MNAVSGIFAAWFIPFGWGGSLQGISRLVTGRDAKEVAETLRGVDCGGKETSCPDQLSKAIEQALAQEA